MVLAIFLTGGWSLVAFVGAAQAPQDARRGPVADEWPTECVELNDGRTYRGLIESEDQNWVHLIQVERRPGKPMYAVIRAIDRGSVARVIHLGPAERSGLGERISRFLNRAEIERGKMEAVRLERVAGDGRPRYRYQGKWFLAECTTDEETTRRLIVRVEQHFAAYRCLVAQRTEPTEPLRLLVFGSLDQYQAYLAGLGLKIQNTAVFFLDQNVVVAGSQLARYAAERDHLKAEHQKLQDELDRLHQDLDRQLQEIGGRLKRQGATRKQIRSVLLRQRAEVEAAVKRKAEEISRVERRNDVAFETVAQQMLSRLYHEMLHAYLENYVFPRAEYHVPHWLNEGLAMVCEAGRVESGRLRLDGPNRTALGQLKADLNGAQPMGLAQVLASDGRDFLIAHDSSPQNPHRHYAYAWGLAHYLTFQKQLLGRPALDRYLADVSEAQPPVERFEQLVDAPLPDFELQWQAYIRNLR